MPPVPWPAAGSLLAGLVSLYFLRYLWPHRDDPGARFFVATIAAEALWALSYGVALLVFDPAIRWLFEIPIWIGIDFIGVFFLAFALEYTGRSHLVRSKWMGGIVALQVVHTAIVATNPLHHVAWSGYHLDPVFGAATVSYVHQPWLFVNLTGISLMIAVGVFFLLDTFVSYGPLYRTQAAAVALSPVLPGIAYLLWLFEVGTITQLNLTPLTFPVHLAFDVYAFFRRDMFETTPATRRTGERAAIDDLGSPVLIVDEEGRIVDHNDEAERVFDAEEAMLGRRLAAYLPDADFLDVESTDVDSGDHAGRDRTVSLVRGGERREYAVTSSAFEDATGQVAGRTVVLQDVTAERRREQRLAVLNRVLRHNLRNDLNVVRGHIEIAENRTGDGEASDALGVAASKTAEVIELGEKARRLEDAMRSTEEASEPVRIAEVLARLESEFATEAGRLAVRIPDDLELEGSEPLLEEIFRNLVENAIQHNDAADPSVEVALVDRDPETGRATFEVRDDGPGIPDHEIETIRRGEETPLEHGSGLGLWLVEWGVVSLGGEVRFEVDEAGTTVILELPTADGPS